MTSLGPLLDALQFAAIKHRDQRRKDASSSPYINHPIALAHLLVHTGAVTDLVVSGTGVYVDAFGQRISGDFTFSRTTTASSGTRVRVLDQQSTWPAAALSGLGTPWNTVQAQGQLQLETRALDIRWAEQRLQVTGQATLNLLDLSSRLSTLRPMGSYRLQLQGHQGTTPMQVQLDTLSGQLHLQGRGGQAHPHRGRPRRGLGSERPRQAYRQAGCQRGRGDQAA